jgi:hypothetical protein
MSLTTSNNNQENHNNPSFIELKAIKDIVNITAPSKYYFPKHSELLKDNILELLKTAYLINPERGLTRSLADEFFLPSQLTFAVLEQTKQSLNSLDSILLAGRNGLIQDLAALDSIIKGLCEGKTISLDYQLQNFNLRKVVLNLNEEPDSYIFNINSKYNKEVEQRLTSNPHSVIESLEVNLNINLLDTSACLQDIFPEFDFRESGDKKFIDLISKTISATLNKVPLKLNIKKCTTLYSKNDTSEYTVKVSFELLKDGATFNQLKEYNSRVKDWICHIKDPLPYSSLTPTNLNEQANTINLSFERILPPKILEQRKGNLINVNFQSDLKSLILEIEEIFPEQTPDPVYAVKLVSILTKVLKNDKDLATEVLNMLSAPEENSYLPNHGIWFGYIVLPEVRKPIIKALLNDYFDEELREKALKVLRPTLPVPDVLNAFLVLNQYKTFNSVTFKVLELLEGTNLDTFDRFSPSDYKAFLPNFTEPFDLDYENKNSGCIRLSQTTTSYNAKKQNKLLREITVEEPLEGEDSYIIKSYIEKNSSSNLLNTGIYITKRYEALEGLEFNFNSLGGKPELNYLNPKLVESFNLGECIDGITAPSKYYKTVEIILTQTISNLPNLQSSLPKALTSLTQLYFEYPEISAYALKSLLDSPFHIENLKAPIAISALELIYNLRIPLNYMNDNAKKAWLDLYKTAQDFTDSDYFSGIGLTATDNIRKALILYSRSVVYSRYNYNPNDWNQSENIDSPSSLYLSVTDPAYTAFVAENEFKEQRRRPSYSEIVYQHIRTLLDLSKINEPDSKKNSSFNSLVESRKKALEKLIFMTENYLK